VQQTTKIATAAHQQIFCEASNDEPKTFEHYFICELLQFSAFIKITPLMLLVSIVAHIEIISTSEGILAGIECKSYQ